MSIQLGREDPRFCSNVEARGQAPTQPPSAPITSSSTQFNLQLLLLGSPEKHIPDSFSDYFRLGSLRSPPYRQRAFIQDDCGSEDHHLLVICRAPLLLRRLSLITQVLAIGFLLVILSCALWNQYLPLLVVATYVIAPLPNWICGRCANPDDFGGEGTGNAILDFGKFCTGFLVLMGIGAWFSSYMCKVMLTVLCSATGHFSSLPANCHPGHDHVHRWRIIDIWNDH